MNCDTLRAHINDYITGEISEKLRKALDIHFEKCRECKRSLRSLSWVWNELGNFAVSCPENMKERIKSQTLHLTQSPNTPIRTFPYWVWAAAAAILVLCVVWFKPDNYGIPKAAIHLHAQNPMPAQEEFTNEFEARRKLMKTLGLNVVIHTPSDATLLGVGVCRLNKLIVGRINYQYQGIAISLFVWDRRWKNSANGIPKDITTPVVFRKKEHSVLVWERENIRYCLVAEIETRELAGIFGLPTEIKAIN